MKRPKNCLLSVVVGLPYLLKNTSLRGGSKLYQELLSNDPDKVESNFFCYAATVLSPHRNVLIFTQRIA